MRYGQFVLAASGLLLFVLGCQVKNGDEDDSFEEIARAGASGAGTNGASGMSSEDAAGDDDAAGSGGGSQATGGGGAGSGGAGAAGDGDGGADVPKHIVPQTPPDPEPCQVAGCPPDLLCADDGICMTAPPDCDDDDECDGDERCGLTGECLAPGECKVTGDCGTAESCRAGTCTVGSDCGQTEIVIDPIPPNVLVLLDISLSMNEGLDGLTCIEIPGLITCPPTKMAIATQAMNQMTVTYASEIYWGLAMFPGNGDCGAPVDMIAPAPNNGGAVSGRVMATVPAGFTPINTAISAVQSSGHLDDPDRKNFLLFISDGGETCDGNNADTAQRIADLHAAGISTFVVGFGGGIDPTVLNDFAQKGGVPNTSGTTSFYQADSAAALETALGNIFERVAGCDFALGEAPEDPEAVWSFLDDVMIERDSDDGWFLDTAANQVSFVGESCARLQGGEVTDIDIVLGCPEPVLE